VSFSSKKAGTNKKPHAIGYTLKIDTTATGSEQPQVSREVKLKIFGMKVDGKHFPTCSLAKIANPPYDAGCPKGALVGSGAIQATLVGNAAPAACDPALHVWNSGQGKLTYFFTTDATHSCLGGALKTGATGPYPGTYKMQGGYFISDTKIPDYVNYPAGLTGLLYHEHLTFKPQTAKVKGKKYVSQTVTGCKKGKRPWTLTVITAPLSTPRDGQPTQTSTVSGSARCSK
jgi:hypothetical protein